MKEEISCTLSCGWFAGVWRLCADVSEYSVSLIFISITYEDGTDRVLRNVGTQNSEAGKSIKRKNKTFKTWRKFETGKGEIYRYIVFCGPLQHLQRNPGQYHASGYNSFRLFNDSRYVILSNLIRSYVASKVFNNNPHTETRSKGIRIKSSCFWWRCITIELLR